MDIVKNRTNKTNKKYNYLRLLILMNYIDLESRVVVGPICFLLVDYFCTAFKILVM